ncbi:GumC family protein [Caulobacter sp.]|uniref:GumC family protein n=1 Tax=Caulobacter sp. TaxID=78 RepID=UPI003BA9174A
MTDVSTADRQATTAPNDLAGMAGRLLRYIPLVGAIAGGVLALAAGLTFLQTPMYTAKTTILFDPKKVQFGTDASVEDSGKDTAVDTQSEVLQSPALVQHVITKLRLDKSPQFNPSLDGKGAADADTTRNTVIAAVSQNLRVKRVGQTMLFEVAFTHKDPIKAAQIANTFAETYLEDQVTNKLDASRKANSMLLLQMDKLRKDVENADRAVQAFKAANNLLSASGSTLTEQELSSLKTQEAIARVQLAEANAQQRAGESGAGRSSNGESGASALGSMVISNLRQQRADASRRLAELESRYGPLHPQVINQRKAVADTDAQIQEELGRINANLRTNVDVAQQRLASVQRSIGRASGELANGNSASVELAQLQRNADATKSLYEAFLARAKENTAQQSTATADARINSIALPPSKPSSPNIVINMALGLIFGMGLGVAVAFIIERWNVRLSTMDDVERRLNLAFLGSLPTLTSAVKKPATKSPTEAILKHPMSSFAEAYRGLGMALIHGDKSADVKIIAVTSALPGEGKTTTSICLARVLALGGSKVLLVDLDMRRRSATANMAPGAKTGLLEVLAGKATLDEVLVQDTESGAWFLPLSSDINVMKSPLVSPAFDALLEDLRARFDTVVIDTAPVLPIVDTRILAAKVDAVALIVKWRGTPMRAVQAAIHQITAVEGIVSGVALSLVDLNAQARSGYGDPHYYYRDFKGYYLE